MTLVGIALGVEFAMMLLTGAGYGWMDIAISAGALLVLFGVLLLPLGAWLDRELLRLRSFIEAAVAEHAAGRTGAAECPAAAGGSISRWLQPLSAAFLNAIQSFRQREQGLRGQLRDMEIRHHVSEAERRQVEAVLNSLRDAVIVTDAFNEIVMANAAAAEIFGFDVEAALHAPIHSVIKDRRLCQLISDARDVPNFTDCRRLEHAIIRADSAASADAAPLRLGVRDVGNSQPQTAPFEVTIVCVENHKHEVGGVVTILRDLTRERELSQLKTDFVSKASHELRTPLASIRAYVEMLVDGEAEDESSRREFYRIMYSETERLGRLIDNMLNISRIEAGIVQIERENVDMRQLVAEAAAAIEPQAKERSLTVTVRPSASCIDLSVEGDRDMLYQVVLNLLSNAVKYTPDGGRISVAADTDNLTRSVVITVSDTGLGIPPDSLPRLFDKFYRVENYKRVAKGTGLGLSLCKHIVENLHHGSIGVESQLGMGSRFWFSVPMRYAGNTAGLAA